MAYYLTKTGAELDKMLNPSKLSLHLANEDTQVLTLADTWYKLESPISTVNSRDFTIRGDPDFDILFTGIDGSSLFMTGDADLSLSGSTAEIEFALFVNNVEASAFTSETKLVASSEIESFGTNGLFEVDENDVLDIRAKCNEAGRTLTIKNLKVTFLLIEVV